MAQRWLTVSAHSQRMTAHHSIYNCVSLSRFSSICLSGCFVDAKHHATFFVCGPGAPGLCVAESSLSRSTSRTPGGAAGIFCFLHLRARVSSLHFRCSLGRRRVSGSHFLSLPESPHSLTDLVVSPRPKPVPVLNLG